MVFSRVVDDFVQFDRVFVPVLVGFDGDELGVGLPAVEFERAVADDVFRTRPFFAVFFDGGFGCGVSGGVGDEAEEVRRRSFEFGDEGVVVGRFHAQLVHVFFVAFGDFLGIFDRVEEEAVVAAGRGINRALPAVDEVVRGERAAVAPFGVAQVEGVSFAVCGDFPFFGDAGDEVAARVFADEAFKEVAQDVGFRHAFCGLRVNAVRLAAVAPAQHAFGIRRLRGDAERGSKQDY